ncbi:MAG: ABC transporter permease [Acidimicrobiales bacterium]|nr:ABC transporter permease [Acidimicrobiales bacterium]
MPQYVLIILLAATANFGLPRLMPGNPIELLLGEDANRLPAEVVEQQLADVGLDQPLLTQYGRYMSGLAQGDLGFSFRHRREVSTLLRERLPWTILLVSTAIVISTILGVALAAFAAWRRGRRRDTVSIAVCTFLESTPPFWIGLLLLIWFGANLKLLPLFGSVSVDQTTGLARVGDVLLHLVLPAATLVLASVGATFLLARAALLNVIRDDYVLVARAKGLRERTIAFRHALPAASLPIATSVLLRVGAVAGGTVVAEQVFSYRGVGTMMLDASFGRDYPLLQGGLFVLTVLVVGINLLGDLLYPRLDPRVRR